MKAALREAEKARLKGETPIGAVIVADDKIIARAHNMRETKKNVLCHAELSAIDKACKKLGGWRLHKCDLYVTLEPCIMCCGAIIQSRIKNLYFGAYSPKSGAAGSVFDIPHMSGLFHYVNCEGGILQSDCAELMKRFFRDLRSGKIIPVTAGEDALPEQLSGN